MRQRILTYFVSLLMILSTNVIAHAHEYIENEINIVISAGGLSSFVVKPDNSL